MNVDFTVSKNKEKQIRIYNDVIVHHNSAKYIGTNLGCTRLKLKNI